MAVSPLISTAASVGAGLIGAQQQKKAISRARREQQSAARAAQERLAPYQEQGEYATQQIREGLDTGTLGGSFMPTDLASDPAYQFRLEQGQQALDRGLAAGGNLYSGQAIKERERYAQGLASQEYDDAYNRWLQTQQNRYNMLSGQQQTGYGAAGGQNTIGINDAQSAAEATMARRAAQDRGIVSALGGEMQLGGALKPQQTVFTPSSQPRLFAETGGIPEGGFAGVVGY